MEIITSRKKFMADMSVFGGLLFVIMLLAAADIESARVADNDCILNSSPDACNALTTAAGR